MGGQGGPMGGQGDAWAEEDCGALLEIQEVDAQPLCWLDAEPPPVWGAESGLEEGVEEGDWGQADRQPPPIGALTMVLLQGQTSLHPFTYRTLQSVMLSVD